MIYVHRGILRKREKKENKRSIAGMQKKKKKKRLFLVLVMRAHLGHAILLFRYGIGSE
jgi:hypothetical protein